MKKIVFIVCCLLITGLIQAQETPSFTHYNDNSIIDPNENSPEVILSTYKSDIKILGNIAMVTVQMQFHNQSQSIKEANLTFPLPEGISISGYALDINGKLRKAVPVEKTKATAVFESIERRQVDPGIIEKVEGNNFRTRIYPIPENGFRTIEISYQYELKKEQHHNVLFFPIPKTRIKNFQLNVEIASGNNQPQIIESPNGILDFILNNHSWKTSIIKENFQPNADLKLHIPIIALESTSILQAKDNKQYYFYGNINVPISNPVAQVKPKHIGIILDNSMSNKNGNFDKVKAFLKEYLQWNQNVKLSIATLNIQSSKIQKINIKNGNTEQLFKWIDAIEFDGGTDLSKIPQLKVDACFLFSDGLSNFGDYKAKYKFPIFTFSTQLDVDFSLLKYISQTTKGSFCNLSNTSNNEIIKQLQFQKSIITNIQPSTNATIFPTINTEIHNNISVTGIINEIQHPIVFTISNGSTESKFSIDPSKALISNQWNIDKLWAQKEIDELEIFYDKNKTEIQALGIQYGLVTKNTSLMVLEDLNDYIKYKITPPEELLEAYNEHFKEIKEDKEYEENKLHEYALEMIEDLKDWWMDDDESSDIDYKNNPINNITSDKGQALLDSISNTDYAPRHMILPDNVMIDSDNDGVADQFDRCPNTPSGTAVDNEGCPIGYTGDRLAVNEIVTEKIAIGNAALEKAPVTDISKALEGTAPGIQVTTSGAPGSSSEVRIRGMGSMSNTTTVSEKSVGAADYIVAKKRVNKNGSIQLFEINNDAEYLTEIQKIKKTKAAFDFYIQERKKYETTPSYYFDMANHFYKLKQIEIGNQIISNLLELKMEDATILKTVYYTLIKYKQYEKANFIANRLMQFRALDPQTYRDLALSYIAIGEYQKALELLNNAMHQTYTEEILDRDEGIEEILLMEINNLISLHKKHLDLTNIDSNIIFNMPVDIRIVLNWNKDNTDFDLHIIDPKGEECSYNKTETSIGGKMSNDFTDGFGPEQFILKNAVKGKYQIKVNYYSDNSVTQIVPSTLMAEIYLHYGTSKQSKQVIIFQLDKKDEKNDGKLLVGEITY